ncbi:MAG TPA: hypothetical protein VHX44_20245, partial [Planctomycetota bacterium]|nr:hypothetical protein [Planctomycetota bacterium]
MAVAVGAWAMFHSELKQSKPGINGPDLNPGIFRLPKKDKFHVDSATLVVNDNVDAVGQPPANRGESWRVVLLEAKDREPMTRSTVLALAEHLTTQDCIALIALVDSPSFPMGVNRIVSVATSQVQVPTELGGELRATLSITTALARLPDGHPAITLLPHPEGPVRATLTIHHQSHADVLPAGWPNRWAGDGRALAQTILDRLAPGGLPLVVDSETRTWLPELIPLSDWGSALTLPPTTERLRWEFAFQEHLVRGWVGLVPGLTTTNRNGVEEPTLDQLLQRMKSGDWQEASATGVRLFSCTFSERMEWFSIA